MAVSAGVVSFFHMAAGITDLPVGAKLSASAVFNVIHDFVLPGMQAVFFSKLFTMLFENITNSWT